MILTQQLLLVARMFADARGSSIARVSTLVFNDGKKLGRIAAGSDLSTSRFEAAMLWFSTNWPSDLAWPAEVLRPDASCEQVAS